jgi:hypothetical protein
MTIYLLGQNSLGEKPQLQDLKDWADVAGITFPVLADTNWTVSGRYEVDGAIPSWTLLGPGAEVIDIDAIPTVYASAIEDALPSDY